MRAALAVLLGLLFAGSSHAATIVLDFEEELVGRIDGQFSVECACVFYSFGALEVWDGANGATSKVLVSTGQEGVALEFGVSHGEHLARFPRPRGIHRIMPTGSLVELRVYSGLTQVGEVFMATDGNGLLDQTISLSGAGPFDRARFRFSQDTFEAWEIVDNIVLETVPEPRSAGLLALASLLGVVRARGARPR